MCQHINVSVDLNSLLPSKENHSLKVNGAIWCLKIDDKMIQNEKLPQDSSCPQARKNSPFSSGNVQASKLRKKIAFLRAESDLVGGGGVSTCKCLESVMRVLNHCGDALHSFVFWIRNLDEPKRSSCLARLIHHKVFEASVMLAVVANTIYIAYETNFEMANLGKFLEIGQLVEILFLVFFSVEIGIRLWVHGMYFFVNDDWSWNFMDAALMFLACLDQILEYANASVGKVGMLRLLRVTFRIIRVLRFLKEVRVMLVAIVGSFISLFWGAIDARGHHIHVRSLLHAANDSLPDNQGSKPGWAVANAVGLFQQPRLIYVCSAHGQYRWKGLGRSVAGTESRNTGHVSQGHVRRMFQNVSECFRCLSILCEVFASWALGFRLHIRCLDLIRRRFMNCDLSIPWVSFQNRVRFDEGVKHADV